MGALKGRKAVVTGGSRGFGRGIVEALSAEGVHVTAIARNASDLAALEREMTGVTGVCGDIVDPVLAARVIEREQPDILVLNAGARGINRPTRLHTWDTFSTQYEVDVKSAFLWTREALLLPLPRNSAIIIGSSGAALRPMFVNASYAAAKAALYAFAQGVAGEASQAGIRVHCLLPVMAPDSEVGSEALKDISKYTGTSVERIIEDKGMNPPVTPAIVGGAVVSILTNPAHANIVGFRISGAGVQPLGQA